MKAIDLESVITGTYIGDSIGLPMEGLTPAKIKKLSWAVELKQRLVFGRGMWSDDTDHTLHMADALMQSEGDPALFHRLFSHRLRFWLSALPPGVGLATLRSIIKQYLGIQNSGVFSAGNGPSMRAAIIGVFYPNDKSIRNTLNKAHTELTHSDPKALEASQLVVEIAASFVRGETDLTSVIREEATSGTNEWESLIEIAVHAAENDISQEEALLKMRINPKKGVSGYSYHTVPAVLYAGLKNNWSFEDTLREIISLGGDTDSTAAIAGALCSLYPDAIIPIKWKTQIAEWPISPDNISSKCQQISEGKSACFVKYSYWPFILLRNLTQLAIIIVHILLRILLPTSIQRKLF